MPSAPSPLSQGSTVIPRPLASALAFTLIAAATSGCTSVVNLRAGAAGAPMPPAQTMMIIGANPNGTTIAAKAQDAVLAALTMRGYSIAPEATARIEIGLTDRLASTGIAV